MYESALWIAADQRIPCVATRAPEAEVARACLNAIDELPG